MKENSLLIIGLFLFHTGLQAQIYDTLPVIVHIIHNGETVGNGTNLSQVQVNSQFDALNEDYRILNADLANTPAIFAPFIGDMGLNFAKATIDPFGNPLVEPGIDRVDRNTLGLTAPPYAVTYINNSVKPQTIWDPYQYLNIWVVNMSNGMLGFSTFPANSGLGCLPPVQADSLRDGIVIHYCAFGRTGNVCPPYHKGRSTTYEVAQWLGLRRLAQTSCGDDCVSDTPLGDYTYGACPSFPLVSVPCNNAPNGDMFMNFMSYLDDSCKFMFTQGQKGRIDTCLTNGTFQSALRLSTAAQPLSVNDLTDHGLVIYPNPNNGKFTVEGKGELTIYNALGEKIIFQTLLNKNTEIDLGDIPKGLYQFRLLSESGKMRGGKFIISGV